MKNDNYFDLFLIIVVICMTLMNVVEKIIPDYPQYDVNQDGIVNAQDYVEIKNYIMNK